MEIAFELLFAKRYLIALLSLESSELLGESPTLLQWMSHTFLESRGIPTSNLARDAFMEKQRANGEGTEHERKLMDIVHLSK